MVTAVRYNTIIANKITTNQIDISEYERGKIIMRRGFWKELRTRALTGILAGTMLIGSIAGPVQMVRAADTDSDAMEEVMGDTSDEETPVITDEGFLQIMDEYKEQAQAELQDTDESPFVVDDLAFKVLKHVIKKSGEKLEDKAFDTVFSVVFGGDDSGKEILAKLEVLEGKIDKITEMLNQIGIFLKKQVLKDSLTLKQADMRAIKAAVDQATLDYAEASKDGGTEKQIKDRRWKVLQSYYTNFSLQGTGDAMTSLRYFCYRLINDGSLNGDLGNYVMQYEKYGKYSFDWDVDRVAFTQAQKDRDVYYLAQMASLTLLYLQYKQEYKPNMQQDGASKQQITDLLSRVVKCFEETPVVKLDTDKIHFAKVTEVDMNGDNDKVVSITISKQTGHYWSSHLELQLANEVREDKEIKYVPQNIAGNIEANVNLPNKGKGYHLMTNAERNQLVKGAKDINKTLKYYLHYGGMEVRSDYITTALHRGSNSPLTYGDCHIKMRDMYFENYDTSKVDGFLDTMLGTACMGFWDEDQFADASRGQKSRYSPCMYKIGDQKTSKIIEKLYYGTLWVSDDSTTLEDRGYSQDEYTTAEGTIVDITKLSHKNYQITLQTDENLLEIICDEDMVEDQNLEEGQEVAVDYCDNGEEPHALSIILLEKEKADDKEDTDKDKDSQPADEEKQEDEKQQ